MEEHLTQNYIHGFEPENDDLAPASPDSLSKRAARRLIQRALVLTQRDRHVRQQIREASVNTLWVLVDSNFEWTVAIAHGKIEFDRRRVKRPDLILTWATSDGFFQQAQSVTLDENSFERTGTREAWQTSEPVVRGFFQKLEAVLRRPVDENGVRLA